MSHETENTSRRIAVFTTGGTIEKTYDEFDGTLENRGTLIKERILSKIRLPYTELEVMPLFSKDSLHMTDYDRSLLVRSIKSQLPKGHPILVLHGTDTMVKSATQCLKELSNLNVALVFTGAMKPMGFEDSDATQNVTEALLAAKMLSPGVYISFHNQIFDVPHVRKNKLKRTFEKC